MSAVALSKFLCIRTKHASRTNFRYFSSNKSGGDQNPTPQGWISRILNGPCENSAGRHAQSHSSLLSVADAIYELQTHDTIGGDRERYLQSYKKYAAEVNNATCGATLFGSWYVLFGNQDQVVNLWRFENGFADLDSHIKALQYNPGLKASELEYARLCGRRRTVIMKPFSYWGEPKERTTPHIYDLRSYVLKPGTMIEWGNAWAKGITYRREFNQDVAGFFSQIGQLYLVFHIWAYPSLVDRNTTRQMTWSKPGWDSTVEYTVPLIKKMQSRILVPNELSKFNMSNPFYSNDDDNLKSGGGLDPVKSYTTGSSNNLHQVNDYEREIEKYMQMSLDSTQRSVNQLDSSDKLAESTARSLLEQREKLERAEQNLDEIHTTTQYTQRSLNSLKSFFGGMFKNKFSRLPKEKSTCGDKQTSTFSSSKSADQLSKIVNRSNGDNSSTLVDKPKSTTSTSCGPSLSESSRAQIQGTRWEAMDNQIDQNLDQMSAQLARLRNWGSALGDEVDDQNRMLDRIHTKTERNDAIVRSQEGQMRKLLG